MKSLMRSVSRAVCGFFENTNIEKKMEKKSRAHFIFILSFIYSPERERDKQK